MNSNNLSKQASNLLVEKVETKLLAICSITGIAITLEVPAIEGIAMEYENPIARAENFLKVSSLPTEQIKKFPQSILAGILLAIYKHSNLIEDRMSSAAQNLSLQSVHPTILIESIKFFSCIERIEDNKYFPRLSLTPKDEAEMQKSSVTNVIKAYYKDCYAIRFPAFKQKELEEINSELAGITIYKKLTNTKKVAESILRARKTKEAAQKELLVRGRKLVRELAEQKILSEKLVSFLKVLFTGDYLLTAELGLKDRISKALLKHEGNQKALELVRIINDNANKNDLDSIFKKEEDEEVEEGLQEVEEEQKPKLSFKEKLALKMQGLSYEDKDQEEEIEEEIEEEEIEEQEEGNGLDPEEEIEQEEDYNEL
jgi:hypothetical protein